MEERAAAIHLGNAAEQVWLLEHPALYTAGTSANAQDLLTPDRFPVHHTGRGGQYTYHGPGQRVAYVMLDLKRRRQDVRCYVQALEDWLIGTLARFNVESGEEDRHLHFSGLPSPAAAASIAGTRSPPSACGSSAGSPCTAWR